MIIPDTYLHIWLGIIAPAQQILRDICSLSCKLQNEF